MSMVAPDPPTAVLEVEHATNYVYGSAVPQAHHLAHLRPLVDAHQALQHFELSIEPRPTRLGEHLDAWGNVCHQFSLGLPHGSLDVTARSRVLLTDRFSRLDPAASPPWERLRDRLRPRDEPGAGWLREVEFALPSPYVPAMPMLCAWAEAQFTPGRPAAQVALALMQRIHAEFEYRPNSTTVDTPIETVLAQRAGVCQDFAHLLIAALRAHGLAARYVSGYLRTAPPDGEPAMVGADASHAWVQVHVPGTAGVPPDGWLDLDPTNDLVPALGHVRLAIGRDYGDVAPLSGIVRGGGGHTMQVGVTTRPIASPAPPTQEQR